MTDGWKDALRELDDLSPSDAVYQRAAQGPSHPELPEGPSRRKRIVAGFTAFAVFALAAGFAWRAFRPTSDEAIDVPPAPVTSTYTDHFGWSFEYPTDWTLTPIDANWFKVRERGAIVSNRADALPSPNAATPSPTSPDYGGAARDLVAVEILRTEGGPPFTGEPNDDTSFPLSPADLQAIPSTNPFGPAVLDFQANGLRYHLQLIAGPDASSADLALADAVIRSVRPASLRRYSLTATEGWFSLREAPDMYPRDAGYATQIGRANLVYVMRPRHGSPYVLDAIPDGCGEGEGFNWDASTSEILITCPDGSEIRYGVDGSPDMINPARYQRRLDALPVIMSWDGKLLVNVEGQYRVPADAWSH